MAGTMGTACELDGLVILGVGAVRRTSFVWSPGFDSRPDASRSAAKASKPNFHLLLA
ncbi:hypothetical protein Actkin_01939 [Actinokineospora sp. UTMC 2448]|nr:hypothetical protein Actkin_01939 [Actinokineospora sp. UTMC 2448]